MEQAPDAKADYTERDIRPSSRRVARTTLPHDPDVEPRPLHAAMRRTALAFSLAVLASARTEAEHHEDLGCSIQGPTARPVRQAHAPLKQRLAELGPERSLREAKALVRWLEETPGYAALCGEGRRRGGRRPLRHEVLFPNATRHKPRILHLRQEDLDY